MQEGAVARFGGDHNAVARGLSRSDLYSGLFSERLYQVPVGFSQPVVSNQTGHANAATKAPERQPDI
jgi:hypothetical protein